MDDAALKKSEDRLVALRKEFSSKTEEKQIEEYFEIRRQLDVLARDFREVVTHPTYVLPFLQSGRLVRVKVRKASVKKAKAAEKGKENKFVKKEASVKEEIEEGELEEVEDEDEDEEEDWGWGVVVNWLKRPPPKVYLLTRTLIGYL